ncbi:hypothetical protein [Amycolatopsis suaedae]|uniref:Secreted protein n=1 Tax=Amycolatopsis suaedae TaxID=2510978 RepID=A0A4Q7J603_9PSEU|nr:hypothetical protein [Amycolatopsis suaedae]RZQ62226.1 hypothetical protein EWH70_18230 [Amycolatopsis suaedae]
MNTVTKLGAYAAALALVAGGGWALGAAAGPAPTPEPKPAGHADSHAGGTDAGHTATPVSDQPSGLASTANGYMFAPGTSTLPAGTTQPFTFRILGPTGAPVTAFDVAHEKRMHLIVVRRDTADYQHLHPELAADGTWWVNLRLPQAGSYRLFADFAPTGGTPTTLGTDLAAPGEFTPRHHPASREATVDGYQVRLDGDLLPGQSSPLRLTVRKDGRDVTDLQPYLGAYGHLVALRTSDLAYLHVHPDGNPGDGRTPAGPTVTFHTEVPSAGSYRLFLDFQHAGTVRTAEFTVDTGTGTAAPHDADGHTHN